MTVICGSLLKRCMNLIQKGIHPTVISDAFYSAAKKADEILLSMSQPVDLSDRCGAHPLPATTTTKAHPCGAAPPGLRALRVSDTRRANLLKAASTSLNSKVVSQHASLLAPMAVDCILRVMDPARPDSVDLRDVKIVKKQGGTGEPALRGGDWPSPTPHPSRRALRIMYRPRDMCQPPTSRLPQWTTQRWWTGWCSRRRRRRWVGPPRGSRTPALRWCSSTSPRPSRTWT